MKMKIKQSYQIEFKRSPRVTRGRRERAFTLAEVMVAFGVFGAVLVSLCAGFSSGFAVLRVARENLRATQILEERMELIRLVRWQDVNTKGFIPTSFSAPFDASGSTNTAGGLAYQGTIIVTNAPVVESYATHLKMIQISVTWKSGNAMRNRQMTTYVSEYGTQKYIY